MEPLDYCSNFLIGGYNSDGSTRLYSLVEEDELLASIRGRIMKKILFLVKIQYVIFEYLLVLCETFGICDLYLLEETGFKKKLDAILDQIGGQLSI